MAGERRGSWGLRDVRRAFKDTQYTDMENMVRGATSNDDMGPDEELLSAIAKRVTRANYYELSNVLWKRINDLSYPRHVLKGLELLHFLLRDNRLQRQIAIDCNLRVGVLEKLLQYWNSKGKYKGTHVREEARKILKLLEELNKKHKEEKEKEDKERKERKGKDMEKEKDKLKQSPSKPKKKKKLNPEKKKPAPESLQIPKAAPIQPVQSQSEPSSPVAKSKTAEELFFDDLPDDIFGDKLPPSAASTPSSQTDIFFNSSPGPKAKSLPTPKQEERDDMDILLGDGLGAPYKSLENKKDEELDSEELKRRQKEERLRKAQELRDKERQEQEEAEERARREKEERLRRAAEARRQKEDGDKDKREREERERKEREERDRRDREDRERRAREDQERQRALEQERLARDEAERKRLADRDEAERKRLAELDAERLKAEKLRLEAEARANEQREALERQLEQMRREKEALERSMREDLDRERHQRDLLAQEKRLTEERLKEKERLDREAEELRLRQAEELRLKLEQEKAERERIEKNLRDAALRTQQDLEARALAEKANLEKQLERERTERERLTQDLKEREERSERERKQREAAEEEERKLREARDQEAKERAAKLESERRNSLKYIDENLGRELLAYARYFNVILGKDEAGLNKHLLPLNTENEKASALDLLLKVRDGLLLAAFINEAVPETIDLRVLNKPHESEVLTQEECQENINLVINAAKAIGVRTKTVADELLDATGSQHRVVATTDFIWEVVRFQLLQEVHLSKHPELLILTEKKDGDDAQERMLTLNRLPGDELLLRWLHHLLHPLQPDRSPRSYPNLAGYQLLLPKLIAFKEGSDKKATGSFAELLQQAETKFVIEEADISHERLNLALTASVFHFSSAMDIKKDQAQTERLKKELEMLEKLSLEGGGGSTKGTGEQVAFRLWINSLNLSIDIGKYGRARGRSSISGLLDQEARAGETREVFVHDLFHDLRDGLFLLRIIDHIIPGVVQWSQVEMHPDSRFKKVSNCNYGVQLCLKLNLVLVGVGGVDIVDGNPKLTLALIWQLMRLHLIEFFKQLRTKAKERTSDQKSKLTGRRASLDMSSAVEQDFDSMLLTWANKTVRLNESVNGLKATSEVDKKAVRQMASFRDPNLNDSLFFLDLLFAVSPRVVDWRQVAVGRKLAVRDCVLNARYTISAARKLGCTIFVLPEHIVSLKPQMILTLIASIMTVAIA